MILSIKKGLKLPIAGRPIEEFGHIQSRHCIVEMADFVGMKPKILVQEGEEIEAGQPLFEDLKRPHLKFMAPLSARVVAIDRGARRKVQSIRLEQKSAQAPVWTCAVAAQSSRDVRAGLLASGLWWSLRARPFGVVADPQRPLNALFITLHDTHPLAPEPALVMVRAFREVVRGLEVMATLMEQRPVFVISADPKLLEGVSLPPHWQQVIVNSDLHPAGLVGTHVHHLYPVQNSDEQILTLDYQDLINIGHLFLTGRVQSKRIIALAGPVVQRPRYIETYWGARIADLVSTSDLTLDPAHVRLISGSLLGGRQVQSNSGLGRYHNQICAIQEGGERSFLGWIAPFAQKFSVKNVSLNPWMPFKRDGFHFTTAAHGDVRAFVPIGSYEQVTPWQTEVSQLLRAILAKDLDLVCALGGLDFVEEDLCLVAFVCPSKIDYPAALRACLDLIQLEG